MRFALLLLPLLCFVSCKNLPSFSLPKFSFGKKDDGVESEKDRGKRESAETAFLAECKKLGDAGGIVQGRGNWLFSATELKRLGATPQVGSGAFSASVAAIADYRSKLKQQGIDLVVALVPPKAVIYADYVSKAVDVPTRSGAPVRTDSYYQAAAAALEAKGVKVVDLTEKFLDERKAKGGGIYAEGSSQWTPLAAKIAAQEIASQVSKGRGEGALAAKEIIVEKAGDLGGKPTKLAVREITRVDGVTPVPLGDGGHGIVLICDAHGTHWRDAKASLAEQLSHELKAGVDVFSGPNARNAQRLKIMSRSTTARNPLSGAKTVIWCFSALDLASADWQKVPLKLEFRDALPQLRTN